MDGRSSRRTERAPRTSSSSRLSARRRHDRFAPPRSTGPTRAAGEPDDERFHSALVAPLGSRAGVPGTLVAYATAPQAFRPEHVSALNELLADVATGLANARRFADVEARLLLDPATGIANARGYEVELGREVARAHRTGRPLSVVLVGIGNGPETTTTGGSAQADQVAQLLTRVTRRSDISCRRGEHEFAILLPETRESGANILNARLREEAKRALGATQQTIAVGHVEWMPDESAEELEARAEAALASPSPRAVGDTSLGSAEPALHSRRRTICAPSPPRRSAATFSTHWLTRSWMPAATAGRSRWSCSTSTGWTISPRASTARRPTRCWRSVARRLSDSVGSGSVHRLGSARVRARPLGRHCERRRSAPRHAARLRRR